MQIHHPTSRLKLVAPVRVVSDEPANAASLGECQHIVAAGLMSESDITPIGAVINGNGPG